MWTYRRMKKMLRKRSGRIRRRHSYTDIAITAPGRGRAEARHLLETRGTAEAIEKQKRQAKIRTDAKARSDHREPVQLEAAE